MRRRLLLSAALWALATPLAAQQEQNCSVDLLGGNAQGVNEGGVQVILIHDPFTATCDDGVVVSANSGRVNQSTGEVFLYGDVYFEDPERQLLAQEATYNQTTAHLIARGDVVYTDKIEGSILRGPELEYFRATEERPQSQMSATRRPIMTLVQQTPEGGAEPIEMVADRVSMIGEDDLSAFGTVVITRTDLYATSGEARYNATTEDLELRQNARINSQGNELTGEVIQARMVGNGLEYLRARTAAELRGEDLTVTAEDLQLFFLDEQLERAVAVGANDSLAEAASPGFRMFSDSLDARFVNEQLSEVHAIGRARAETVDTTDAQTLTDPLAADAVLAAGDTSTVQADSTVAVADPVANLASNDLLGSDWVSGDTIIGYFEQTEPDAGTPEPDSPQVVPEPPMSQTVDNPEPAVEIRRIVAIGSAQSLYRLRAQNDPEGERRDLNLVIGDRIELEIAEGELEVAAVTGLEYGVYLEASAPAAAAEQGATPNEPEILEPTVQGGGAR